MAQNSRLRNRLIPKCLNANDDVTTDLTTVAPDADVVVVAFVLRLSQRRSDTPQGPADQGERKHQVSDRLLHGTPHIVLGFAVLVWPNRFDSDV